MEVLSKKHTKRLHDYIKDGCLKIILENIIVATKNIEFEEYNRIYGWLMGGEYEKLLDDIKSSDYKYKYDDISKNFLIATLEIMAGADESAIKEWQRAYYEYAPFDQYYFSGRIKQNFRSVLK